MTKIILITVFIGISISILLIIAIKITRGKQTTRSSLIQMDHLIGSQGIVTVPFDYTGQGKIRVNVQDSLMEWRAVTESPYSLQKGDQVIIIGLKKSQAWVIPDTSTLIS